MVIVSVEEEQKVNERRKTLEGGVGQLRNQQVGSRECNIRNSAVELRAMSRRTQREQVAFTCVPAMAAFPRSNGDR